MYHSIAHSKFGNLYFSVKFLFVCILIFQIFNVAHAASQGKLGTESTASVEIAVTVNQSLSAVSPNELLLNNFNQSGLTANKPFCIAHNGFNKNASVPYELIVDRLIPVNEKQHSLPFNIYLEDKNSNKSKQLLIKGTALSKHSSLKTSDNLISDCSNTGAQLLIEKNNTIKKTALQSNAAGLLILVVSPN
ncbi:MAG: hypothetical protein GKR92_07295 [Gammaproteobacteria bacterium]|nr:MAG: hypothetical protein GKR92_07295 [Gammaproteobacteria bacterium]